MAYLNRFFSTTRAAFIRYIGYNIESLTPEWAGNIINYTHNGAVKASFTFILHEAEVLNPGTQKVGNIVTVEIL
jgi:hypothetical protein